MKTSFNFFFAALAIVLSLAACNDDTLEPDGKGSLTVNLVMPSNAANSAVRGRATVTASGTGFAETFMLNTNTTVGARSIYSFNDLTAGTYTLTISPADTLISGSKFLLSGSNVVTKTVGKDSVTQQTIRYNFFGDVNGIIGNWVAKGNQLSKTAYPNALEVDSLTAVFGTDNSFTINTFKNGVIDSVFTGTYKQTGSTGQRTLEFYQVTPSVDTLKGIGRSFIANKDSLRFQVVPNGGTVPTAFGSKAAIQSFRRISY